MYYPKFFMLRDIDVDLITVISCQELVKNQLKNHRVEHSIFKSEWFKRRYWFNAHTVQIFEDGGMVLDRVFGFHRPGQKVNYSSICKLYYKKLFFFCLIKV